MAILARGIPNKALFAKLLRHRKLCMSFNILEHLISENLSYSQEYLMRMSHSKYRPILMSAHQVLQSYALFSFPRTCTPAHNGTGMYYEYY